MLVRGRLLRLPRTEFNDPPTHPHKTHKHCASAMCVAWRAWRAWRVLCYSGTVRTRQVADDAGRARDTHPAAPSIACSSGIQCFTQHLPSHPVPTHSMPCVCLDARGHTCCARATSPKATVANVSAARGLNGCRGPFPGQFPTGVGARLESCVQHTAHQVSSHKAPPKPPIHRR